MKYNILWKVSFCWVLLCVVVVTYGQETCVADLVISDEVTTGQTSNEMTSNSITASNIIANGAAANYQAENFILLSPGFHAQGGSNTSLTIAPCSGTTARTTRETVKVQSLDISLYPNPTGGSFTIQIPATKNPQQQTIEIYSLKGVPVLKKAVLAGEKVAVDLKNNAKGIYLVKYFSGTQVVTKKVLYK